MIKKKLTTLLSAILFILVINSEAAAQGNSGVVYFMRLPTEARMSAVQHAFNYCNVFIDSNLICTLDGYKYFSINVPVGKHVFAMRTVGKKIKKDYKDVTRDIVVNIESGKTYYIQFVFNRNSNREEKYCKLLSEELAKMILPDLKIDKTCMKQ